MIDLLIDSIITVIMWL